MNNANDRIIKTIKMNLSKLIKDYASSSDAIFIRLHLQQQRLLESNILHKKT